MSKQSWTRWTWTSEFQDYHIVLWSVRRVQAFENWFRKLRTTQTDTLFNKIYDKTKPTTRSVQNRRKWFRKWATSNCLNCSRRAPKRSAKHVYRTGVQTSSIAHADISCKKQCPIEVSLNIQWTFFQFQSTSSRREDLTATDTGKSQETTNIIWPINWKRDAKRGTTKESMTDSYEIMFSLYEWLKTIEMKKFVEDGMFLQMKITLVICQKKNTSTTRTNGGSISISMALTPYHWENVLISSKRCLPWNVYTKKLEENKSSPFITGRTNNGSRHRVRPLPGGNGKTPGGLPKKNHRKSRKRQVKSFERSGLPVVYSTLAKISEDGFLEFILFCTDRSFTADDGLL